MKIETYLNAMTLAYGNVLENFINFKSPEVNKADRQYHAFRARILREFAILQNFAEVNGFDRTQAWFWTDEWMAAEREVDEYLGMGKVQSFDTMENYLRYLEDDDYD